MDVINEVEIIEKDIEEVETKYNKIQGSEPLSS